MYNYNSRSSWVLLFGVFENGCVYLHIEEVQQNISSEQTAICKHLECSQ